MKLLALLVLSALNLPVFAQTCYVDMIEKHSGRVVQTFISHGNSTCIEGMKDCRLSIRLDYSSNRQYPNGSLDCVRADRHIPRPHPIPVPGPRPQPRPIPHPVPQPIPYPDYYHSVRLNSLILDQASSISSSDVQTKIIESMISNIRSYNLESLVRVCAGTRTYQENAYCLIDGVRRAPEELLDESSAIHAVGQACVLTKTWSDERACFLASLRNNRLPSLNYLAQSCSGMYNSESASRCYRSVFNVR